jgi:hypothetical protein
MKKTITQLALTTGCLIALASAPALAIDLYGFGSYWDKGDVDGKCGVGVGVGLPILTEHLRLDGRISFVENSSLGHNDDLTLVPVDLGLQAHLAPGAPLDPYAVGGLSFIYADAERSDVDSSLGSYLGGGLVFEPFPIVTLFGEVTYRFQKLAGGRGDDIDVSGMTGNVGVKISF